MSINIVTFPYNYVTLSKYLGENRKKRGLDKGAGLKVKMNLIIFLILILTSPQPPLP